MSDVDASSSQPYVLLLSWTDQTATDWAQLAAGEDEPADREQQIKDALETIDGELIGLYWILGQWDMVVIVRAPSAEQVGAFAMGLSRGAGVRTITMPAFDGTSANRIRAQAQICCDRIIGK
jgi:uncharacterized protein with GYD domain